MPEAKLKIIGNHPEIRNVRRRIRRVAPRDMNVCISGEPGTEKELTAYEIHRKSLRSKDTFESLDCHMLAHPDIKEARRIFVDHFVKSRGGTLFLNNIEAAPEPLQNDIYRIISENMDAYSGMTDARTQTVRIIAGTSEMSCNSNPSIFRQLAIVLSEYMISIPPLRKRKNDIYLLFDHHLSKIAGERGYNEPPAVPESIMNAIIKYDWPGNTKELVRTVESLLEMSPRNRLNPEALPFIEAPDPFAFLLGYDYNTALNKVDEYLVRSALNRSNWNQSNAARMLNMTEGNIRLKLKKYNIRKDE